MWLDETLGKNTIAVTAMYKSLGKFNVITSGTVKLILLGPDFQWCRNHSGESVLGFLCFENAHFNHYMKKKLEALYISMVCL